jgi:hypothetical protein
MFYLLIILVMQGLLLMPSIKEIIQTRNPVLGQHPRLDSYIAISKNYVSKCTAGDKYNLLVALATLHQLTLDGRDFDNPDGISGRIIKEKEGDLAREMSGSSFDGYFDSTNYGKEFQMIKKGLTFGYRNRFISGCR